MSWINWLGLPTFAQIREAAETGTYEGPGVTEFGKKLAIGGLMGLVGLGIATYTVARVHRLAQD